MNSLFLCLLGEWAGPAACYSRRSSQCDQDGRQSCEDCGPELSTHRALLATWL